MAGGYSATGNALVHGMAHMPNYLVSPDNPDGKRTEEILLEIRAEILVRMASYAADPRPEARTVMENNLEIAQLLTEAIHLDRSEERRVGKEWVSTVRSRGQP